MDSSPDRRREQLAASASACSPPPPEVHPTNCVQRDSFAVCPSSVSIADKTLESSGKCRAARTRSGIESPQGSGIESPEGVTSRPTNQETDTKMLSSACCDAWQPSQGTSCDAAGGSSFLSERRPENAGLADNAKLLQKEGRYEAWAPFLSHVLPSRDSSLLLGQICFDVTPEDDRGSWLLPEELITHEGCAGGEENEGRQVFTNTPVSEEEQQAIDQVLLQLLDMQEQNQSDVTVEGSPGLLRGVQPAWLEQLVLRYLHSCGFDKQKTLELLQSTLAFRTQHLPVTESEVYSELRNVGACYWHGRDRKMRPLLVVSLLRLQQLQRDAGMEEKVMRIVIFCLEFFLRHLCVAGKVENWSILCDLNGTSISGFPLPLLLKLMQLIQGAYRGRLYRFYVLNAPRLFNFVAGPIISCLPATTAKKVRVFTHLDDWHQERRTEFADHQLEKKFGGTTPDISENWYPFRFPPGPFDPSASRDPGDGNKAAVRWESDKALHATVHASVHTGASLHTSLLRGRTTDQQGMLTDGSGAPTFRCAAWLHHLPELSLAPATIRWADETLRHRLHGHHEDLLQHLHRIALDEDRVAASHSTVSAGKGSGAPTTAALLLSPTNSLMDGASCTPSHSAAHPAARSPASSAAHPAARSPASSSSRPVRDDVVSVSPTPRRQGELPSKRLDDEAPPALACEGRPVPSAFPNQILAESSGVPVGESSEPHAGNIFSTTTGPDSQIGILCQDGSSQPVSPSGGAQPPSHDAAPPEVPSGNASPRRQATLACQAAKGQQRWPESLQLESSLQERQQAGRGYSFSPSSFSGDSVLRGGQRSSASAHARAYWALEKPLISPQASMNRSTMPSSVPSAQTSQFSEGAGMRNLQMLFAADEGRPHRRCSEEAPRNLGPQSAGNRAEQPAAPEQQEALELSEAGHLMPLQHPPLPTARSFGGPCRTVSLSRAAIIERTMSTPPAAAWHTAPACERSPNGCLSSNGDGLTLLQYEPFKDPCQTERRGYSASTGSNQQENQPPRLAAASAPTACLKCKPSEWGTAVYEGCGCSGCSRLGPLMAATRIHAQTALRFVSPVAPDLSPSNSVFSGTANSASGSCLLHNDNVERQRTAAQPASSSRTQLPQAGDNGYRMRTPPSNARDSTEVFQTQPIAQAKTAVSSQTSRVVELRRLRRMVRALCDSVSGNHSRFEQHLLDEYDPASGEARPRRRQPRHACKPRQSEQQHHLDKCKRHEGLRVGLRRRLSSRWLSRSNPSAANPSGPSGVPKPAIKRRYYRRLRLYRRRTGAVAGSRFAARGSSVPTSGSNCDMFVKASGTAGTATRFSMVRGTSRRLIRLPISLSDRMRRGTRGLATRMQRRARSCGSV